MSLPTRTRSPAGLHTADAIVADKDNAKVFNPRPAYDGRQKMFYRKDTPNCAVSIARILGDSDTN